jgi:galactitol PTS system EIIB component
VACGTGIATSTHVADRLARIFRENGLTVDITQCRISEIGAYEDDVDVIVSTAQVARRTPVPVVSGIAFLTGIGEEEATQQVLDALKGA